MKTTVLLSGGLDSTVLAWKLAEEGHRVYPVSIDYGQRHIRELQAAALVCHAGGWLPNRITLPTIQTEKPEIPDGHYTDTVMKATVSPNRNMILLAVATAWAMVRGCEAVVYAAHTGDHTIYPDCRPEFVAALAKAIELGNWDAPTLLAPFVSWSKTEIVREGHRLGAPMHLTWSCYRGGTRHCGKCGTCVERREAFHLAGVPDPTEWA